jgi:DNA-binding NarL/FixJ family response regulator
VEVGIFGRDESLRLLGDATAAARAGRGGLVMLRADPGLGMTALLDAHLLAARESGMRTYRVPVMPLHGRTTLSAGVPEWCEPAMVVIDDLHRADDATLLALHEVAEGLRDRSLLVITGRHRGVAPTRFARLDQLATVHDLLLLDDTAVRAMAVQAMLGEPSELLLRFADGARGNPWLLARITADGRASEVTAWVAELADGDMDLLRFTALLDEPAPVDELAAVIGLAPVEVLAGVGRLAALGFVEEHAGLVRLRHPMVREAVATTSVGLRAVVARALASREVAPEVVANQLTETHLDAWTVAWLADHADRLATTPTPAVVDVLARAVDWLPPGDPRLHPVRAALAESLLSSGRLNEARRVATASLAARPETPIRQRLRASLAQVALAEMDPVAANKALAPERLNGELPGRLAAIDAYSCLLSGDLDGATLAATQATPAAAQDPVVEVALLHIRAIGLCLSRDLAAAMDLLDQAAAMLDIAVSDRSQWLLSRLLRAVVQDLRHDPAVLDTVEEARPVALQLGAGWLAWLHTVAALAGFNTGQWDQALDEVETALAMPDLYGMARPLHGVAAHILLHRGDIRGARDHIECAEEAVGRGVAMFYEHLLVVTRAALADIEKDPQKALELVRAIADGGVGAHQGSAVTGVVGQMVRIALAGGDRELADRLVTQMQRSTSDESPGQQGALLYCQGLVNGDVDLLLAAAKEFAEGGSLVAAARAGEDAAAVLAASGRSTDARAVYHDAIERYTRLAADGDISRANATMREHGVSPGVKGRRGRPKQGWDSLTVQENRVAKLVAQGLGNKEIAARMVLSERTVHSHVSKILTKLGCSSRVEIALGFKQRE